MFVYVRENIIYYIETEAESRGKSEQRARKINKNTHIHTAYIHTAYIHIYTRKKNKKGKLSINRWNTFAVWSVCEEDEESGVSASHRILIRRKTEYPRCSV